MNRREFLKSSLVAGATILPGAKITEAATDTPRIKSYRPIGKTGLRMSDISLGTGRPPSPSLILRAIDRGINYIDTAPDYGQAEEVLGEALRKIKRENLIIASKFCRHGGYPKHLSRESKRRDYIRMVEGSLKRLGTDYLDICFVHAIGEQSRNKREEQDRLLNDELLSAVTELKRTGKIRFLGVSSHGPHNMEDLLLEAVRSGHYDIILSAFNFMKFPRLPDVIKEAHSRGVGVIAMKTLAGAKDMEIKPSGVSFPEAALKWVLKHKEVSGLIITMKSINDLNTYLKASGEPFRKRDALILKEYARLYSESYCRTGCGICEEQCPEGVPIATTLRYRMYFEDYGQERAAMEAYRELNTDPSKCVDCKEKPCEKACPYGLGIAELLIQSDRMLRIPV